MKRHSFHEKVLYQLENGAILACVCLFTPFFGISDVTWKNILVLILVLALFTGAGFLSGKRRGLYLLFSVICVSAAAVIAGARAGHAGFTFWSAYLRWCIGGLVERTEWLESFQLLQTSLLTAVSFIIQILTEKFKALKTCLAGALAAGMLACLFLQVTLTHMSVVFASVYIVMVCAERLQEGWKKTRSGCLGEQMFWLSPFIWIYLLLMTVSPTPETPYDWQWARKIYTQVRESFTVLSQNILRGRREDFNTAMSGFSDDGEMGGDVRSDGRKIMSIQAKSNFVTNVYLTGKVYDTFDGRQWRQEYSGDEEERFLDSMETLYAVRRLDDEHVNDYLKETRISIRYEFFHTGYVFAPLKTTRIEGSEKDFDYSFAGGDLLLGERKGYGTEYDVTYYQLNVGDELFERLLGDQAEATEPDEPGEPVEEAAPDEPDISLWETVAKGLESSMGRRVTPGEAEAHRRMIYDNYLDQVILSEEAKDYLSRITGDVQNPLEKLRAIERELGSYTYTKTPGRFPDSVTNAGEFLDYFLLESRQGYCTYFATAFVLLARAEGIPARYVQGFCVPAAGSKKTVVLSGMAHSWPEVYLDGVGWIPFEPTPGFGQLRYTPWRVSTREDISSHEIGQEWNQGEVDAMPPAYVEELEEDAEPAAWESEEGFRLERYIRRIVLGILTIFAVIVLVLVFDNLICFYRYQRMCLKEKLKVEAYKNLRALSWLGIKREEYETLQELRERIALIPELGDIHLALHFIEDYEDVVYGEKSGTEEMLKRTKEERKLICDFVKNEKKQAYIFYWLRMFAVRYR